MKAREIAELVGGELLGDSEVEISSVASVSSSTSGQITFVERPDSDFSTKASCVFVPTSFEGSDSLTIIGVPHPKLAFVRAASVLHPAKIHSRGIHPSAVVSKSATLGSDVAIEAFCAIGGGTVVGNGTRLRAGAKLGENVTIGDGCVLHPNVFVEDGCTLGSNVVLHAGVVVGADGFGYVRDESGRYNKFPQVGTVVIENDVEIGSNTCIDRGALGETRIGEGTKIDNLVQVGHNVQIGRRCVIAAQTGISGSTIIEDDCVIGGQVGFGDHAHVKSGAVIGSQAGVLPGKIVRPGVWWGTPIQPLEEYKRQNAHMKGLGRLKSSLKELTEQVRSLSERE